ncbi:MAG TPA: 30S ribosomal protein S1 [Anaerolineae bacterium]|nr:30S ribosomal protein S1 [Anaerolineae bacterium]
MSITSPNGVQSLESLLDSYLGFGVPQTGEIREGFIVADRNGDLLVDIGAKSEGIIPHSEVNSLSKQQRSTLTMGSPVRVCVIEPENARGDIILSYLKVSEQEDWMRAVELQKSQEICECEVIGFNRGGLLATFGSLRGFIPASQLGYTNQLNRAESAETQLRSMVGKVVSTKVLESDQEKGRLILSEMAADKELRAHNRAKRLEELEVDQVLTGHVINLTDFGAFIDIGGIEGLVHSSELSWKHVSKPSKVLSLGQEIQVKVIGIDHAKERITFSMKQLEANPWAKLNEIYEEAQLVDVTVTQLTRYGAFARISDEFRLEGLIHISELSSDHIKSPDEVVKKGEKLTVRIIRLDGESQQIGFSLKQVTDAAFMDSDLEAVETADEDAVDDAAEIAEDELMLDSAEIDQSESVAEFAE